MRSIKLLLIAWGLFFVIGGASALRKTTALTSNDVAEIKSYQSINDSLNINIGNSARNYIRRGNKLYADSLYEKAGIEYKRALTVDPTSVEALYNYGNTLLMRQKGEEALKQYSNAINLIKKNERGIAYNDKDKAKLADIYHNMGVLLQSAKQYEHCIEAYKNSLRNDPIDHETRYNLSLALKMKKEQEQQQQDKQNQQEQEQEQEKKQEQQNSQKEQEQQQEEQQKQQQQENRQSQISKENAEQLLKAVMQDEKDIQEKVKKEMQEVQPRKFDKDW